MESQKPLFFIQNIINKLNEVNNEKSEADFDYLQNHINCNFEITDDYWLQFLKENGVVVLKGILDKNEI